MHFMLAMSVIALAVLAAATPQPVGQRGGVAIPLTKGSTLLNDDGTVDMEALISHIESAKHKIIRGLDNYEMNTGKKHPAARSVDVEKRGGSVPLTKAIGLWYGEIGVGTPSKPFTVLVDTGVAELLLPSIDCDSSCGVHTLFDRKDSSTAIWHEIYWDITYGDGSNATGVIYDDTVSLGGYTAVRYRFGAENASSFAFATYPADGLLGLGFRAISEFKSVSLFEALVYKKQLPNERENPAVFSIKLSSSGAGSELYIGGANSDLYTGSFSYVRLTRVGFWEVQMGIASDLRVFHTNLNAIIDTGTHGILGDPQQVSDLYNRTGGVLAPGYPLYSGIYAYPCDSFPSIKLRFGTMWFDVKSLNIGPIPEHPLHCLSGLYAMSIGYDGWVIGTVFLENYYTIFDFTNKQVGFATLA